jgi:GNAT superfamily N-acetyltransferase
LLVRSTELGSILMNRLIGLGTLADAGEGDVADAVERARALGDEAFLVQLDQHTPSHIPSWLEASGLARYPRSWVRMVRRANQRVPEVSTDLHVRRASIRDAAGFGRIVARGFDLPDASAALWARIIDRPRWHAFVAVVHDCPVAAAGLFVEDGIGYLAFAATDPSHRSRGAQSALMARRLQVADALGCAIVFADTGEPVPGDPQHSHRNMLRARFAQYGVRANYAPEGFALARAGTLLARKSGAPLTGCTDDSKMGQHPRE